MTKPFSQERELVAEKFDQIVDGLIVDPDFRYEVKGVEVFERRSMTGDGSTNVFMINVETNNRAQLLGQINPFEPGGYDGYFHNLYRSRIVEMIKEEIDPDYPFSIQVNPIPTEPDDDGYVDRHMSLEQAIDHDILPENSQLADKMREYNISQLVLAGGTLITGPLAGSMESVEQICREHEIDSMLEIFCGSAAHSKIALEHGASHVECVDINIGAAKENLKECNERVTFHEIDAFEFTPDRTFDLILADPYFEVVDEFIDQRIPALAPYCKYYFMSIAFSGGSYWEERVMNRAEKKLENIQKFDTGRLVQLLGEPIK